MAHLIEEMFYIGETPWHKLGKKLQEAATAEEAIKEGGLDWIVEKKPIFLQDGSEIKSHKAMVRNSDNSTLGITGNRYTPLQNIEAFSFFDSIVAEGSAIYHTAGSLNMGKRIWLLAKLPDFIKVKGNDIVDKYLLLTNTHDGTSTVQIKFTPIRVVCNNTLTAALNDTGDTFNVRHTKSVAENIKNVKNIIGITNESFKKTTEVYQYLAEKPINVIMLQDYLKKIIPDNENAERKSRTENIRKDIVGLFESDPTNNIPETKETIWSAYNSVVQYIDFQRGTDKNRLNSAWFGEGARLKNVAFEEAIKLAA